MPVFLSRYDVYRILQRELPENVYADGPPSAFFTTADMDSLAACLETAYTNASGIYQNFWPQTADEKIDDQEIKYFGVLSDSSLTLAQRQQRLLTRIQNPRGITVSDMIAVVKTVIGADKDVEIIEWGNYTGGWMINYSQLGVETFLNAFPLSDVTGPNLCSVNPADYGYTEEQWLEMRQQAYTYEVRIYGYTMTDTERAEVDTQLSIEEPARSAHVITDGLDPSQEIGGDT